MRHTAPESGPLSTIGSGLVSVALKSQRSEQWGYLILVSPLDAVVTDAAGACQCLISGEFSRRGANPTS